MADAAGIIRRLFASLFGGLLYVALNWIPIIGPFAVGVLTGYLVGGGFRQGFKYGAYAAAIGSAITAYLLLKYGLGSEPVNTMLLLFLGWVLVIWNTAGVVVAGLGGGFGAIGKDIKSVIPQDLIKMFRPSAPKPSTDYIICPMCGQGNVSEAKTCIGCGKPLR